MSSTTYYWDEVNDNLFGEEDENGEVIASYTHEPGRYGELIAQERDGETRYYNYDGLGNTSELTDEDGNVTDTYEYSAFGEEIARTGTTENPFGYKGALGYYTNRDTNDVYVRGRTYEPKIARWLSIDPLQSRRFSDGTYVYVKNSPLILFDPNGMQALQNSLTQRGNQSLGMRIRRLPGLPMPGATSDPDLLQCGDLAVSRFLFMLNQDSPCEGYFVQKIVTRCNVNECDDCPENITGGPDIIYYEAFPHLITTKAFTTAAVDTAQIRIRDEKCGAEMSTGEVRYYCKDPSDFAAGGVGTGDLEAEWGRGKIFSGGGCNKVAGGIPAIDGRNSTPNFWKEEPLATGFRFTFARWNCCHCMKTKPYYDFGASPEYDPKEV